MKGNKILYRLEFSEEQRVFHTDNYMYTEGSFGYKKIADNLTDEECSEANKFIKKRYPRILQDGEKFENIMSAYKDFKKRSK